MTSSNVDSSFASAGIDSFPFSVRGVEGDSSASAEVDLLTSSNVDSLFASAGIDSFSFSVRWVEGDSSASSEVDSSSGSLGVD